MHCLFLLAVPVLLFSGCAAPKAEYTKAVKGYPLSFPRDHYAHHDFRSEWWYHTGHIETKSGKYGFELVFFRHRTEGQYRFGMPVWKIANPIYFAHFAITDEDRKKFEYAENVAYKRPLNCGSLEDSLLVWTEDWRIEWVSGKTHLKATMPKKGLGLDIALMPQKGPVVHGVGNISRKGEGGSASYYISLTRLDVQGYLIRNGVPEKIISGTAWMDHEMFTGPMNPALKGWDWFSIQLDNNTELMVFLLHKKDGTIDMYSSGTIVFPDGKYEHIKNNDFSIKEISHWKSRKTRATYPVKWVIEIPGYGTKLSVKAVMPEQELVNKLSGVKYWEGAVKVSGTFENKKVAGQGYVEMSGRAGDLSEI